MGLGWAVLPYLLSSIIAIGVHSAGTPLAGKTESGIHGSFRLGEDGWVSLFEGASLRGWKPSSSSDWVLDEGILRGDHGSLLNRWCWVDFELTIVYRGSGFLRYRVGSDQVGHIGFEQPGFRLNVETGELWAGRRVLVKPREGWSRNEWHRLDLNASQGTYRFSIDRGPLVEVVDSSFPSKGRVGFEADGQVLEVRTVRIRPLNREQLQNIPADNYYCFVCHANFEFDEPLVALHENADVGCASCHGPSLPHRSDEDNVTPPDILYRRPQIEAACLQCHERHEDQAVPEGKSVGSDPVCTDCHGEHHVANPNAGL